MNERLVEPAPGFAPRIGRVVTLLEDARERTLAALEGDVSVDYQGVGADNSIGTLLYHVAVIELDWVFSDILGVDFPDEAHATFTHDVREVNNRLTPVLGDDLATHLHRLDVARRLVLSALTDLGDDRLFSPRDMDGGVATPAWVFYHLMQHEAEHRGQIMSARGAAPHG